MAESRFYAPSGWQGAGEAIQAELIRREEQKQKDRLLAIQEANAKSEQQARAEATRAAALKNAATIYRKGDERRPGDTTTPGDLFEPGTLGSRHMVPGTGLPGPQASASVPVGGDITDQPPDQAAAPVPGVVQQKPQFQTNAAKATSFVGTVDDRENDDAKAAVEKLLADPENADLLTKNPEIRAMLKVAQATNEYKSIPAAIASASREGMPRNAKGLTPNQIFAQEQKLAGDWRKNTNTQRTTGLQLQNMQTALANYDADPVAASEAVRVFWEKVLDPSSVVREGEYARQTQGLSLLERMKGLAQSYVEGGGKVPKEALAQMVNLAQAFQQGATAFNQGERQRVEKTASDWGLDAGHIFFDNPTSGGAAGAPAAAPAAAPTAAPAAPGVVVPKPGGPPAAAPAAAPPSPPPAAAAGPVATIPAAKVQEYATANGISVEEATRLFASRGVVVAP